MQIVLVDNVPTPHLIPTFPSTFFLLPTHLSLSTCDTNKKAENISESQNKIRYRRCYPLISYFSSQVNHAVVTTSSGFLSSWVSARQGGALRGGDNFPFWLQIICKREEENQTYSSFILIIQSVHQGVLTPKTFTTKILVGFLKGFIPVERGVRICLPIWIWDLCLCFLYLLFKSTSGIVRIFNFFFSLFHSII